MMAGTGFPEHFQTTSSERMRTKFGNAFVSRTKGGFYLMPRHGPGHTVPPHAINYRANVEALRLLGVRRVIATGAVGSMNPKFRPGQLGIPDQFLDFTKGRKGTFFDLEVRHTDMTQPYSASLNSSLVRSARRLGLKMLTKLVYVGAEGPRFETAAEIRMFRKLGGDAVGMTGVPEVVLANEVGIKYASVLVATNWAAGMQRRVSHDEVLEVVSMTAPWVKELLEVTIKGLISGGRQQ